MLESQLHFLFLQNSNIEDITEDINQKLTIPHRSNHINLTFFQTRNHMGNMNEDVEEFRKSFWLLADVSVL